MRKKMQFICANYVNVKQLEWNKLYGALEAEVMPFMLIRIFFHVLCEWFMLMVDDYYLEEIVFVFCSMKFEWVKGSSDSPNPYDTFSRIKWSIEMNITFLFKLPLPVQGPTYALSSFFMLLKAISQIML